MSLLTCPHCQKKITWEKVYKKINQKRFSKKHLLKCPHCGKKLAMKQKQKNPIHRIAIGLLWLFIPVYLIAMVFVDKMDALIAILLVILYHFVAMHVIIVFHDYHKKIKK